MRAYAYLKIENRLQLLDELYQKSCIHYLQEF